MLRIAHQSDWVGYGQDWARGGNLTAQYVRGTLALSFGSVLPSGLQCATLSSEKHLLCKRQFWTPEHNAQALDLHLRSAGRGAQNSTLGNRWHGWELLQQESKSLVAK